MHEGSVSRVEWNKEKKQLVSVSTYGEIFTHERQNGQLVSHRLFKDNNYDFRDAYTSYTNGTIYAISRTGNLVILRSGKTEIFPLNQVAKPFGLNNMNNEKQLLIVGEKSLALLDLSTDKIIGTRQLDFQIKCVGRVDNKPLLFDDQGRMHVVNSLNDLETSVVPVPGRITSFASSKNQHLSAYGTMDGTIYLIDGSGAVRQLVGHRSRVTKIKFNGNRLYSSSYDGQLLFWAVNANQIRPITLFQSNSWLLDFTYDTDKDFIWVGDANGNLTENLISMKMIQERLRKNLGRNFTQDEWDYFIGKSIPFRSLIGN
jgi:WD40 repeat protein